MQAIDIQLIVVLSLYYLHHVASSPFQSSSLCSSLELSRQSISRLPPAPSKLSRIPRLPPTSIPRDYCHACPSSLSRLAQLHRPTMGLHNSSHSYDDPTLDIPSTFNLTASPSRETAAIATFDPGMASSITKREYEGGRAFGT